jgi:histone-lysine N-methyltransferase SETMAR
MRRVAAKFVPRLLTPEQKEHRVAVCQDLRERATDNPSFTSRIITGDESWVYGYDPETKQQSLQWKSPLSPRPKKARMSRSSMKPMLIVFFDIRGIVHCEFVPQGQTVNKKFYCEVLRHLREKIR